MNTRKILTAFSAKNLPAHQNSTRVLTNAHDKVPKSLLTNTSQKYFFQNKKKSQLVNTQIRKKKSINFSLTCGFQFWKLAKIHIKRVTWNLNKISVRFVENHFFYNFFNFYQTQNLKSAVQPNPQIFFLRMYYS